MLASCSLLVLWSAAAPPQSDASFNDTFELPRYYRQFEAGSIFGAGDFDGDGRVDVLTREVFFTLASSKWINLTAWTLDAERRLVKSWEEGPGQPLQGEMDGFAGAAVGDFTGDGQLDFVFDRRSVFSTPKGQLILHTGNGDGTFGPQIEHDTPTQPASLDLTSLDAGDFDGDGVDELLLAYTDSNGVDQLLWCGVTQSALSPTGTVALPFTVRRVHAEDFDGDGRDEAVAVSEDGLQVQVFGYFGSSWVSLASIQVTDPVFLSQLTQAEVGDLDGDGDQDVLVWMYLASQGLSYQAFINAGGAVIAGQVQLVNPGTGPVIGSSKGMLADWDDDGDADLFLTDGGVFGLGQGEHLYENVGSPLFEHRGAFQLQAGSLERLTPQDLDGDGFRDFLGERSIAFGAGVSALPTESTTVVASSGLYRFADFDGDGDLDARVFADSASGTPAALLLNDASGAYPAGLQSYLGIDPGSGFEYGPILAEGDFDGDGLTEALVREVLTGPSPVEGDLVRLIQSAGGTFVEAGSGGAPGVVVTRPDSLPWPVGDVDLDGFTDVVVEGGVHLNPQGTGVFQAEFAIPEIEDPLVVVDWDADGDDDVVCARSNGDLVLARNLGGLAFASEVLRAFDREPYGQLLDRDGDGDLDLIVTAAGGRQVQIYDASPTGMQLGPALDPEPTQLQSTSPLPEAYRSAAATDLDGDGQLDLLLGMFEFTGAGLFQSELLTWLRPKSAAELEVVADWLNQGAAMVPVDIDGDGDLDAFEASGAKLGNVWSGPAGGGALQFGSGTPGTGGVVPVLGVSGPYHKDSPTLTKRLRRGVGGGLAFYAVSQASANLPGFPTASSTTYIDPNQLVLLQPISLTGAAGAAGEGEFDFPVQVQPFLTGQSFWEQAFVIDPAATDLVAASNALFVQLGN